MNPQNENALMRRASIQKKVFSLQERDHLLSLLTFSPLSFHAQAAREDPGELMPDPYVCIPFFVLLTLPGVSSRPSFFLSSPSAHHCPLYSLLL